MSIIVPLFASNLIIFNLEENLDLYLKDIKKTKFYNTNLDGSKNSQSSSDMQVLEKYPDLKKIILDKFYQYALEVLNLDDKFIISKSWITKLEKESFSQPHLHKHSFYSGVFYFDEYQSNSGNIEFFSPVLPFTDFLLLPKKKSDFNIYNSAQWILKPKKNLLIFFPSYLNHRISENTEKNTRYSLAFNIVPYGKFGKGDSEVCIDWKMC